MSGEVVVVSGTGTEVGKTVVTAAVAALAVAAGRRVAVLKPAQTGVGPDDEGDVDVVARLVGAPGLTTRELARYPDPLAPATAARRAGLATVSATDAATAARELAATHDLVLVEGAGGLLVRLDDTDDVATLAAVLRAPVLVVAAAGLGTLNATALTTEALRARRIACAGVVIGSWPRDPGLAERCNLADLPDLAGAPLVGAVPVGAGALGPDEFRAAARAALAPRLGGEFDAARLTREWGTLTDRDRAAEHEGAAR